MYQIVIGHSHGSDFAYCETLSMVPETIVKAYREYRELGNRGPFRNARVYEYDTGLKVAVGPKVMMVRAPQMGELMSEAME